MIKNTGTYVINTKLISIDDFIRIDTCASIEAAQTGFKLFTTYKCNNFQEEEPTFKASIGLN